MNTTKTVSDLLAAAIGAKTHFDAWWTLSSQAKLDFPDEMKDHPDFFSAVRDAHYTAYVVYFAQLFDKQSSAISLRKFLRHRKAKIENDKFSELDAKLTDLERRAAGLLKIRHNLVAHVNGTRSEDEIFKELKTTWYTIRDTIYDSANFTAELVGADNPSSVEVPRNGRISDATNRLLFQLRRAKSDA